MSPQMIKARRTKEKKGKPPFPTGEKGQTRIKKQGFHPAHFSCVYLPKVIFLLIIPLSGNLCAYGKCC